MTAVLTHEDMRPFRVRDLAAIGALALVWFVIARGSSVYNGPQLSYMLSLLVATVCMSFAVHLIRKVGAATLFYLVGSLVTYRIQDIGMPGASRVVAFVLAGLVFECTFMILKIELKNIPLDIVAGTALSSAAIPVIILGLVSPIVSTALIENLVNMVLLSFFTGLAGSIISFVVWYRLSTKKQILRFQYT